MRWIRYDDCPECQGKGYKTYREYSYEGRYETGYAPCGRCELRKDREKKQRAEYVKRALKYYKAQGEPLE